MKDLIRSDKVAGMITGVLGLMMLGFGVFGLAIVAFQRGIESLPRNTQHPPGFENFEAAMKATQDAFITYLPIMAFGGLIFAAAGYYIYRGSITARWIARANAILGFVWIAAYSVRAYDVMQTMQGPPFDLNMSVQLPLILGNSIFMAAFPAALLYILKRPN